MNDFKNKTAVVTGAASGIGKGLAKVFIEQGMKVVLADIEKAALEKTEREFKDQGAEVLAVLTDVSKPEDLKKLAQKTLDRFAAVHILCNNAGVGYNTQLSWQNTPEEWNWVLSVNLMSVVYGIQTFIPIMLNQNTECAIINTASIAGLTAGGSMGIYSVSKFGVVALSESLYKELKRLNSKIQVSLLCPGFVDTNILNSLRNKPESLNNLTLPFENPETKIVRNAFSQAIKNGMKPDEVGEKVLEALKRNQFYIITHESDKKLIQKRFENIIHNENPNMEISEDLRKYLPLQ